MTNQIGILDYGCGNLKSVKNAIEYCGYQASEISESNELAHLKKIILPGVGAFDHAMKLLESTGLGEGILEWIDNKSNKLLGICLGMQLLCRSSEESKNDIKGLNLIAADVKKLKSSTEKKLPNIGWSHVNFDDPAFRQHSGDYYFVHSYGVYCDNLEEQLAHTSYGDTRFASAVTNGFNVFGCQFHPEKSHKRGLTLLKVFCEL